MARGSSPLLVAMSTTQGDWKDDKKHGKGKKTSANGDVSYEGEWKDGDRATA